MSPGKTYPRKTCELGRRAVGPNPPKCLSPIVGVWEKWQTFSVYMLQFTFLALLPSCFLHLFLFCFLHFLSSSFDFLIHSFLIYLPLLRSFMFFWLFLFFNISPPPCHSTPSFHTTSPSFICSFQLYFLQPFPSFFPHSLNQLVLLFPPCCAWNWSVQSEPCWCPVNKCFTRSACQLDESTSLHTVLHQDWGS